MRENDEIVKRLDEAIARYSNLGEGVARKILDELQRIRRGK